MAGKEKLDLVHQNSIHVETIRKEQRYQKLHTEFSINPHRKYRPMSRKPTEVIAENSDFIDAFHKAHLEPTKKYAMPLTASHEIGWISAPLIPSTRNDKRFNFCRISTDVTIHQEKTLRAST
ncbi:protein FAM183A isoform X2 [Eleginops maclovinus]|uniref:protein FAM183A isoform X2 n=1 Tax=Eleginops maclovinus TaxID=56733 RepID=UPI0030802318